MDHGINLPQTSAQRNPDSACCALAMGDWCEVKSGPHISARKASGVSHPQQPWMGWWSSSHLMQWFDWLVAIAGSSRGISCTYRAKQIKLMLWSHLFFQVEGLPLDLQLLILPSGAKKSLSMSSPAQKFREQSCPKAQVGGVMRAALFFFGL